MSDAAVAGGRAAVGVVFVNFHSERLIGPRARALQDAGFPVVVADNSGTFAEPGIECFDTGGNVGFGMACNVAAGGLPPTVTTLCLHNPDLDVEPAGIDALCRALAAQPRPGVVTPAELQHGQLRSHGYRYPSARRELALAAAALRRRGPTSPGGPRSLPPTGASLGRKGPGRGRRFGGGGLWVVDRRAFDDVGGFDPSYFLYAEDLDLWHRLGLAGRSTGICRDVVVEHRSSTGSAMGAPARELLRWLGVERFAEKYGRPGSWRRMRLAHRALLPAYRRRSPELVGWIGRQWRAGAPPGQVQLDLRRRMEGRRAGNPV